MGFASGGVCSIFGSFSGQTGPFWEFWGSLYAVIFASIMGQDVTMGYFEVLSVGGDG